jgi:hypothetical protein
MIGFELSKLKKKNPNHYQAMCPGCRTINKISVKEMQAELDGATEEIQKMIADYEANKAKARAGKQAKAKAGTDTKKERMKRRPKARTKAAK